MTWGGVETKFGAQLRVNVQEHKCGALYACRCARGGQGDGCMLSWLWHWCVEV